MGKKKRHPKPAEERKNGILRPDAENAAEGAEKESPGVPLSPVFVDRMRRLLGEEECQAFLSSYEEARSFSLRINPLKLTGQDFLSLTWEAGEGTQEALSTGTASSRSLSDRPTSSGRPPVLSGNLFDRVAWEEDGFYYPEELRPGRHPRHEAGMYYIQEASAMAPAVLCGAVPGERILDLCAAPGGKSTKLGACLRGEGILVANEIHPERARILSANIERMGIRNALVTSEPPGKLASRFPLFFDRVLVDAPCSGEGMFRKEEEALAHWSPENVRMCAERQREILEDAALMLRPGGILVYSTCTFSPEENEGVLSSFLEDHGDFSVLPAQTLPWADPTGWGFAAGRPDWVCPTSPAEEIPKGTGSSSAEGGSGDTRLKGAVRLWPHRLRGEGHFAAVLKKAGGPAPAAAAGGRISVRPFEGKGAEPGEDADRRAFSPHEKRQEKGLSSGSESLSAQTGQKKRSGRRGKPEKGQRTGEPILKREEAVSLWKEFCAQALCLDPGQGGQACLSMFGETLCAIPEPAAGMSLEGVRVLRPGLELGTVKKGRFIPSHALGMALRPEEVRRSRNLTGADAWAWLRGEAIPLSENMEKGWILVCIDGCAAGWGKAAGNLIKNHYPRGLRKGSGYRPS